MLYDKIKKMKKRNWLKMKHLFYYQCPEDKAISNRKPYWFIAYKVLVVVILIRLLQRSMFIF